MVYYIIMHSASLVTHESVALWYVSEEFFAYGGSAPIRDAVAMQPLHEAADLVTW